MAFDQAAWEAFLAEPSAERTWLLEIDALSLAEVADRSAVFGGVGFGELSFSEQAGSGSGGLSVLRYSSDGYVAKLTEPEGQLVLSGSADDGALATAVWDFTTGSLMGGFDGAPAVTRADTATRVNAQGYIEDVAADTARFDYDPITLEPLGLLIEPASTNTAQFTDNIAHVNWIKNDTIGTADYILSPDGTQNGALLTEGSAGTAYVYRGAGVVAGQWLTMSRFIKRGNHDWVQLQIYNGSTTQLAAAWFNLATGQPGSTQVLNGATIRQVEMKPFRNGWYRCSLTAMTGTGTAPCFTLSASADLSMTRVSNSYRYEWGGQNEENTPRATSYIRVPNGTPITRAQDVVRLTSLSGIEFSATEGTMIIESKLIDYPWQTYPVVFSFNDGTGSEEIMQYPEASNRYPFFNVVDGGANQCYMSTASDVEGVVSITASAWKANDFATSTDGLSAATDVSGTLPTVDRLYFGDGEGGEQFYGWISRAAYFPKRLANATLESASASWPTIAPVYSFGNYYDARLSIEDLYVARAIGADGIGGLTEMIGEVSVLNSDGALDTILRDYAIDGRGVRILLGRPTDAYEQFGTVLSGIIKLATVELNALKLDLSDGIALLDRAMNETVYAGSGGTEGGDDLIGKPKPVCYGQVFNVSPPLVDSANLIYQVHDGAISDVPAAYDRGIALTKVGGAPAAGQYQVDTSNGRITLGATPSGTVTCDVLGDASGAGYIDKTGDIVQRILEDIAIIDTSNIDTTSIATLNTDNDAAVGVWVGTERQTVRTTIDALLANVGAYGGFNRQGLFSVGVVKGPITGVAPDASFEEMRDVVDIRRGAPPAAVANIAWRIHVAWQRNYTVQNDLASGVSAARRTFAAEEARIASATNASVQSQHLLATEFSVRQGLFAAEADADTEALRLINLWGVERTRFAVVVSVKGMMLDIGDLVELEHTRFGLTPALMTRLLAHAVRANHVELTLMV